MKTIILNDDGYGWVSVKINATSVYFKGNFWFDNKYYSNEMACKKLEKIFRCAVQECDIQNQKILENITGHFAFIISNTKYTIAVVDRIRSIPLYLYQNESSFYISSSANKIRDQFSLVEVNQKSLLSFKTSGYTLGNNTIIEGLNQLVAGEYIFYENNCRLPNKRSYYRYFVDRYSNQSEKELLEDLHNVTMKTFSKLVESTSGAPIFIPLSGGYDSRLILSILKKMKYDNITTYTYGLRGVWEVKRAKFIAEKLDTKWIFVEFKPNKIKQYYYTNDRKDFFHFASGLNSTPHLAEYYALLELRKRKLIPPNAIIINGQSGDFTSGGHLPDILLSSGKLDLNSLTNSIINKHFSLWDNLKNEQNISTISNWIIDMLGIAHKIILTKEEFAKYFEFFECQERQSKFVVNGQRAYEWFGYEWRLPLWSDELMGFWVKVDWKIKYDQKLLLKYLKIHNFGGVFDKLELPPQFSYFPFWAHFVKPLFYTIGKINKKDISFYNKKYLQYYMTYAPYYPQKRYCDFLKNSSYHRNPVSYWSQSVLKEL